MAIVRLRPEDIRRAIADGALTLQFQPQVYVRTGRIVGAEAFVRWPHPLYGLIGPSNILQLVELGRFHLEFDRWVLGAVAAQVARWQPLVDVPIVAVNVWAQTLRAPRAIDMVRDIVMRSGVSPRAIEIECPRGTVRDPALAECARRLHVLGVRVASEEFGDASLSDRARDFDTLKVPYPVARELLVVGSSATASVSAIVESARASGARVVADSVESVMQEDALRALGCDIVQGYLYGPEVSASELRQLASTGLKKEGA